MINLTAMPLLFVSASELVFILFVVLLLFGAKKIPELARGLGKGLREFQSASDDIKREISDVERSAGKINPDDLLDSSPDRSHPHRPPTPSE